MKWTNYFLLLLLTAGAVLSVVPEELQKESDSKECPFLVPAKVFVGDRAQLFVPVTPIIGDTRRTLTIDTAERLPQSDQLRLYKLTLEYQGNKSYIIIDFSAYTPGLVEFPPLSLGPYNLESQQVYIASVLNEQPETMSLSPLEPALLVPGTLILVYTGVFIIILLVVVTLLFVFRGKNIVSRWKENYQKKTSTKRLQRTLKRLESLLDRPVDFYTMLSTELRRFLSTQTGIDFFPLTGQDLTMMTLPLNFSREEINFLSHLLRTGDTVRFGNEPAEAQQLKETIQAVKEFIASLEGTNRQEARKTEEVAHVARV
jgi:hypothetical protein